MSSSCEDRPASHTLQSEEIQGDLLKTCCRPAVLLDRDGLGKRTTATTLLCLVTSTLFAAQLNYLVDTAAS
ncbi:hypothetical protein ILYODFUR_020482 [Ilyodon furcidens]|uniref:Uncharacterized protein n=1 Tax=Ilyodon furcidens TaxID=33524 RepID=A0ABV0U701_9TELE